MIQLVTILTIMCSSYAHANSRPGIGDLVLITDQVREFYQPDPFRQAVSVDPRIINTQDLLINMQNRRRYTRADSTTKQTIFVISDIFKDRRGHDLAILRFANLWHTENFGFLLTGTRTRLASMDFDTLRSQPTLLQRGEILRPSANQFLVTSLEGLAPAAAEDSALGLRAGDLVKWRYPNDAADVVSGTGIIRFIFGERVLLYPMSAYGQLRRQLSRSGPSEPGYLSEMSFSPILVDQKQLAVFDQPLSTVFYDRQNANLVIDRTWKDFALDYVAKIPFARECAKLLESPLE